MNVTTRQIQTKLAELGFNPGPIDGIPGALTRAAVKAFQASRNLEVDGIVGPRTIEAMFNTPFVEPPMPWIEKARSMLGLHEVTNAKTLDKALGMDTSAIPWCGAFVALGMGALPDEPVPVNPLWARNWLKFGFDPNAVYFGNVAVFERGTGGHVGFVVGHDKTYLHILGGNQSNKVSVAKIAKSRLLGYRWPETFRLVGHQLDYTVFTGKISTNEA